MAASAGALALNVLFDLGFVAEAAGMTRTSLLLAAIALGAGCGPDSPPNGRPLGTGQDERRVVAIIATSGTAFPSFHEPFVPVKVRRDTALTATEEPWFIPNPGGDLHITRVTRPETELRLVVRALDGWTVCLWLKDVHSDDPSGEAYAYRQEQEVDRSGDLTNEYLEYVEGEVRIGTGDPRQVEFLVSGRLGWFRSVTLRGGLAVEHLLLELRVPRAVEAKGRGR